MSAKLPKLNFTKILRKYDLPHEYVVSKFYELGFYPKHNKYNNTYQCCCPVCREGESFGKQKRCYYLPDRTQVYCHNCGHGWTPYDWIQQVGGLTYDEIWAEVEGEEYDVVDIFKMNEEPVKVIKSASLPDDSINLFDPVQLVYWRSNEKIKAALDYIKKRRLGTASNRPDALYMSLTDFVHKNRLVIPFKDEKGKIIFYQSRKIFDGDEGPQYTSKLNSDKTIFGLDKITTKVDSIFIFEGPIDSFFVKNGVGIAGITKGTQGLTPIQQEQYDTFKFFDKIWCLDSQWLDTTAREKTEVLINQGETVFIWPAEFGKDYKDLNELCVAKELNQISPKFIKNNSFKGAAATMKFRMLKAQL